MFVQLTVWMFQSVVGQVLGRVRQRGVTEEKMPSGQKTAKQTGALELFPAL